MRGSAPCGGVIIVTASLNDTPPALLCLPLPLDDALDACDEPTEQRCSGDQNESAWCSGDALCRPFHRGPRCGVCDLGAFRHVDGGCVGCEETAVGAIAATAAVVPPSGRGPRRSGDRKTCLV